MKKNGLKGEGKLYARLTQFSDESGNSLDFIRRFLNRSSDHVLSDNRSFSKRLACCSRHAFTHNAP